MTLGRFDRVAVERFVEQTLLGPFDLTIRAVQDVPVALDRVRRQFVLARFIGKLAVDHGMLELRRRLDPSAGAHTPTTMARTVTAASESVGRDDGVPNDDGVTDTEPSQSGPSESGATRSGASYELWSPEAADLALPDYEHLPAAHIVAKLGGLQQSDRDAIELFESIHRHRRTILGKIEQLRSP